ncbi:hypothetical protein K3495_g8402, partial [Podosphaera aphanis]
MNSEETSPARRSYSRRASADKCLQVITLHNAGHERGEIAYILDLSYKQVIHIINRGTTSPKRNPGGKRKLDQAQADELETFVRLSRRNRQMTYIELAMEFSRWGAGVYAIRSALKDRGYSRSLSRAKPPISEVNMIKRLEWALNHRHWTIDDWSQILWSHETWVTDGRHRDAYITRKPGDELEYTCLVDKTRKNTAWMFWGSFHGTQKGTCLFWEKIWGSITGPSYCEHIVPHVADYMEVNPELQFMQDNAPPHKAAFT